MEELVRALQNHMISSMIDNLIKEDKLDGFIEFGRARAKEDGMDSEELMGFFDELEEQFCDNIDWDKVIDITQKVTGCKVMGFKGDKSIIIENEEMDDEDCFDYYVGETQGKINLEHINQALKLVNVKLEFIEAMNLPFDADGFQNIIRFKVVELDK